MSSTNFDTYFFTFGAHLNCMLYNEAFNTDFARLGADLLLAVLRELKEIEQYYLYIPVIAVSMALLVTIPE